ncbi:Hypothetical_protein [Hexamita inflata]|uniref:Hypothetical_protein n=1 Tax=Hexamita inflata TaxID=28002 RepID=A0AA86NVM5_9EUKA|nr:Hypothetical protein HINF_LOCUS14121 [Hexamita inflata]
MIPFPDKQAIQHSQEKIQIQIHSFLKEMLQLVSRTYHLNVFTRICYSVKENVPRAAFILIQILQKERKQEFLTQGGVIQYPGISQHVQYIIHTLLIIIMYGDCKVE